jgi:hypothetical protein
VHLWLYNIVEVDISKLVLIRSKTKVKFTLRKNNPRYFWQLLDKKFLKNCFMRKIIKNIFARNYTTEISF